MEFKKCARCGCFFASENNICYNCQPKDALELSKLNNYIEKYGNNNSLDDISVSTGISLNNLNRYIIDNGINLSLK